MGQVLRVTDQAQLDQSLTLGPAGFQTASQARQQIPSSLIAIRKNVLPQPAGVIKRQMQPRLRRDIHLLSRKAASHGENSFIVSAAGVVIHPRDPLVRGSEAEPNQPPAEHKQTARNSPSRRFPVIPVAPRGWLAGYATRLSLRFGIGPVPER